MSLGIDKSLKGINVESRPVQDDNKDMVVVAPPEEKLSEPEHTPFVRKRKRTKDPRAPKNPRSAYLFYVSSERARIAGRGDERSFKEQAREIGATWKALSDASRAPYIAMASEDRLRYAKEREEYVPRENPKPTAVPDHPSHGTNYSPHMVPTPSDGSYYEAYDPQTGRRLLLRSPSVSMSQPPPGYPRTMFTSYPQTQPHAYRMGVPSMRSPQHHMGSYAYAVSPVHHHSGTSRASTMPSTTHHGSINQPTAHVHHPLSGPHQAQYSGYPSRSRNAIRAPHLGMPPNLIRRQPNYPYYPYPSNFAVENVPSLTPLQLTREETKLPNVNYHSPSEISISEKVSVPVVESSKDTSSGSSENVAPVELVNEAPIPEAAAKPSEGADENPPKVTEDNVLETDVIVENPSIPESDDESLEDALALIADLERLSSETSGEDPVDELLPGSSKHYVRRSSRRGSNNTRH